MKKKKRIAVFVVLFLAVVFLVLFLWLPLAGWPAQKRTIEQINRNCDVPYALAMPETELKNTDAYVMEHGFGCYGLENEDIFFSLAGYPDTLNEFHVVSYEIKSSKYTLMGLRVGCSLDNAIAVMKQNGFALHDHTYRKNGVGITIYSSDNIVTSFSVYVKTSNILGVVY